MHPRPEQLLVTTAGQIMFLNLGNSRDLALIISMVKPLLSGYNLFVPCQSNQSTESHLHGVSTESAEVALSLGEHRQPENRLHGHTGLVCYGTKQDIFLR